MATSINDRIDVRISREQKELIKYASELSGFKNLSEFIIFCVKATSKNSQICITFLNCINLGDEKI